MSRDPLNIALAIMTALLLAVAGPWLYQHLRVPQAAERALPMVHEGQRQVTLKVTGMVCGSCAARVGDQLQATAGVAGCDVDPEAKRVYVVCEQGVADTALVSAVRRAGTEYAAAVVSH